jgi:hypothetical protein
MSTDAAAPSCKSLLVVLNGWFDSSGSFRSLDAEERNGQEVKPPRVSAPIQLLQQTKDENTTIPSIFSSKRTIW